MYYIQSHNCFTAICKTIFGKDKKYADFDEICNCDNPNVISLGIFINLLKNIFGHCTKNFIYDKSVDNFTISLLRTVLTRVKK